MNADPLPSQLVAERPPMPPTDEPLTFQPTSAPPPVAELATKRVSLRVPGPGDYGLLRDRELGAELILRWRHKGTTPSPEEYARGLWAGVLSQYLVVHNANGAVLGLVSCYGVDFPNAHAYLAAAKFDQKDRRPLFLAGAALFIDHLFSVWPFRKLCMQVPEFNLDQIGSGIGRLLVEEGRLREHMFLRGRYWDQVQLAIFREDWERIGPPFIAYLGRARPDWDERG